jgi:ATP diphosphatase
MAEEIGAFAFGDVVEAITTKMIRRHPHVFGDEVARAAGAAKGFWEKIKAEEKRERAAREPGGRSILDAVSAGQPGLARAVKLQAKAGSFGFDWNDPKAVLDKLREETAEIAAEIEREPQSAERVEDEIGDLLFTVANLARHMKVDPDQALRRTNAKFIRRFSAIERGLAEAGKTLGEASLDEMEALWQRAKSDA